MVGNGTVRNGVIVFDEGHSFPNGTRVEIIVVPPADAPKKPGTLSFLLKYAGKAEGLPADFAAQHDHYIHRTPKR